MVERGKRLQLETPDIYGTYYGEVFKGYFYAPVAGNYTFRGSAADQFTLIMNQNYGTTNGLLTEIIASNSSCMDPDNYYLSNISSTMGQPISLQAGKYYYM